MSDRPATEAIIENAQREAREIAEYYGQVPGKAEECGVLKAYLTDMERRNETPEQFARRQGWME